MGKFGKVTHVSTNPLDCSIIFLGSPKIGKTTLMKEVAEKTVGKDGYMFFEMYREQGADKIEGIVSEPIETWEKFTEVVDDIVENKAEDYPNLKIVFIDTWDNAILLAENEAIRLWNRDNPSERTDNINQAYKGFQRGQEVAGELLDNMTDKLKSVGVKVAIIMHIKNKEVTDPVTEKTYQQVTADVSQKYFNRIKKNADLIAVAYVDRTIVDEKTGKKDIKGKDIVHKVVKDEARKIKFRDSGYAIDAGGRLKFIDEEIPFDADAFIDAITKALQMEIEDKGASVEERKKEDAKKDAQKIKEAEAYSAKVKQERIEKEKEEELESLRPELLAEIQSKFKGTSTDVQKEIRSMLKENGYEKFSDERIPVTFLQEVVEKLS